MEVIRVRVRVRGGEVGVEEEEEEDSREGEEEEWEELSFGTHHFLLGLDRYRQCSWCLRWRRRVGR